MKTILFDLDGTLLPMHQETFLKTYMGKLVAEMGPYGYEPKKLMQTIMLGIEAMVKNDGSQTNETAFWDTFTSVYGKESKNDLPKFEAFYQNTFPTVKSVCGFDPMANEVIKDAKARGYRVVLATNPMFPDMATDERIRWAGLDRSDFELVTTYENCTTSKPNPAYYLDVAKRVGADPKDCLMVGNDVGEDMIPAESVGMQVFLLTKYMINKDSIDVSRYPRGNFVDLLSFIL
ncbi:MAG: HAD family hydrolase [Ruminococcaceae bacterium]|nr:HAD family hydrolase [Oscillospiraceae bacterium]